VGPRGKNPTSKPSFGDLGFARIGQKDDIRIKHVSEGKRSSTALEKAGKFEILKLF
jgi:hypothetical protein